jgi:hypothetical protein
VAEDERLVSRLGLRFLEPEAIGAPEPPRAHPTPIG